MKNLILSTKKQVSVLLLFVLASCQSSKEEVATNIFNTDNLPTQSFLVSNEKDTMLQSINNLQIKIPKNAFVDSLGNPVTSKVNISLKEAFTLADMIIGGLSTTTDDGKLLESAGMFNLNASVNNQPVFIKKGINLEITIPANGLNTTMQHFTGEITANNQIKWKNPVPLANAEVLVGIDRGKELFNKHCSQCHATDAQVVGPALYNVHKVQSFKWFSNFVRYPQKTIESGNDKRSIALIFKYKQYMPNFDSLTDRELKDIWDYIKNESALLDKDADRKKPLQMTQKLIDSIFVVETQNRQLRQQNRQLWQQNMQQLTKIDTISDAAYTLSANQFGWFNYDSFIKTGNYTPINFAVMLNGEYENSTILLVIKKRKAVIGIYKYKKNIYCIGANNDKILLPKGEKAVVIATCYKKGYNYTKDNVFFVMQEITLGKEEMISLNPLLIKSIAEPMNKVKQAFKLQN